MTSITECPCCGNNEYEIPQTGQDDAIMACPWCTGNLDREPHLCARAKAIQDLRALGVKL